MRKRKLVAAAIAAALIPVAAVSSPSVQASSHREAPLIAQDPVADNTDLYLFRDVADPTKVDIVANYIGLEDGANGPNFAKFGDDVVYEINIDNNGDVADDITYQFRFRTIVENGNTFLYNTGQISPSTYANQNVKQVYSVRRISHGRSTVLATNVPTPPVNVGIRSTPNYDNYVAKSIKTLPGGGKVFAGQRSDPFFVDLGSIFDLLGLRPLNAAHAIPPNTAAPGRDSLSNKNVHSIVLQVPITSVSKNGNIPTVINSKSSFIGVYASSRRQRVRVLSARGGHPRNLGQTVQVSRLGLPLVNEVLIPLAHKDKWNAVEPEDDAQFFPNILDPEPAKLIPALYPGVTTPPGGFNTNGTPKRADIVAVLSGQGAGLSAANALPPADLLRLNLAVPPVQGTPANRLGILASPSDPGGFPNGRRLTDDIVDIELRLLAGGTPFTPSFNHSPNNALTDGVDQSRVQPLNTFPYVGAPVSGYSEPESPPPSP